MIATSPLELTAVVLSVVSVLLNIRQLHWAWPAAFLASASYCAVFWRNGLYGNASLHLLLAGLALWGWTQWLRGRGDAGAPLRVSRLTRQGWMRAALAIAVLWPAIALVLDRSTDSDVPWWDAFPTAASLVAQVLLARKVLESWALWIVVDLAAVGLYAVKGLWLTLALYLFFIGLCIVGWRQWTRQP